jgi:hypothetical protein
LATLALFLQQFSKRAAQARSMGPNTYLQIALNDVALKREFQPCKRFVFFKFKHIQATMDEQRCPFLQMVEWIFEGATICQIKIAPIGLLVTDALIAVHSKLSKPEELGEEVATDLKNDVWLQQART